MPNADVAKQILKAIELFPENFDMGTWVHVPDWQSDSTGLFSFDPALLSEDVKPEEKNLCGTTLCAAGWAVAVDGWVIPNIGNPIKTGRTFQGWEQEGARILGITDHDAGSLFYVSDEKAKAALQQLADGADEIDWDTIYENDDYDDYGDECDCGCNSSYDDEEDEDYDAGDDDRDDF